MGTNIEATAALILLFAASLVTFHRPIVAFANAILLLISCSSVAVLISFTIGPDAIKPTVIALSFALLILSFAFAGSKRAIFSLRNLWFLSLFALLTTASQLITRQLGLSSVAFTDGHTIIQMARSFQAGEADPLAGFKALKRGFGLPAMQSLGFTDEYFVGLMPLFFLAAILATGWLAWVITGNLQTSIAVTTILLPLLLTTEALARHIFLMNTHSIAWLVTALLLGYATKSARGDLSRSDSIGVLTAFTAVGFLRFDYLLLFAGFTLFFIMVSARSRPLFALSIVFQQVMATLWWTSTVVEDFPFFGPSGQIVIALLGMVGAGVLIWLFRSFGGEQVNVKAYPLFVAASLVAGLVVALTNTPASVRSLFINLFLGEGLWGFTAVFVVLVTAASFFRPRVLDKALSRQLAGIGVLTVGLYLLSKYGDGLASGGSVPTLSRVGFGDSLNRTLITWAPFLVLPIIRLVGTEFTKRSAQSPKEP